MVGIVICMVIVATDIIVISLENPQKTAERKIRLIAEDYWENYFYDRFRGHREAKEAFSEYEKTGFPRVYLRQLLIFDNERHASSREILTKTYKCDTNTTTVVFYPEAPFEKNNYRIEYKIACETGAE